MDCVGPETKELWAGPCLGAKGADVGFVEKSLGMQVRWGAVECHQRKVDFAAFQLAVYDGVVNRTNDDLHVGRAGAKAFMAPRRAGRNRWQPA